MPATTATERNGARHLKLRPDELSLHLSRRKPEYAKKAAVSLLDPSPIAFSGRFARLTQYPFGKGATGNPSALYAGAKQPIAASADLLGFVPKAAQPGAG